MKNLYRRMARFGGPALAGALWLLPLAACAAPSSLPAASRYHAAAHCYTPEDTVSALAAREDKPRDLDTHHLFASPPTRAAWQARARQLRAQILFSAGLWPMPDKTPLHPRVTGRIEGPDYTIENVAIETMPGFYLCGNLYRPKGKKGPFPAIANPHGHWSNGRLEMQQDVPKAAPPPAPPAPGQGNLISIGVNLARQGFVVFAYDMTGYNDTNQVDHRFAGNLRAWLWNVSLMGVQLWNSLRAVDYLESLPDVDRRRIGATGASGGGTQTFLLTAVDDRIQAAVPVNMVSASMQGGCLCENGPGLRVGTDNVEIAAMMAPKPLLLVSCTGDWTKNAPAEEWPAIRKVYDLYGAGDRTAVVQFNYQHNYNVESREAMYAWFGRWLRNDPNPEHFRERPFEVDVKAMRVWNAEHPAPPDALKEPQLVQALIDRSEQQLAALLPQDAAGWRRFQAELRPALAGALAYDTAWKPARMDPPDRRRGRLVLIVSDEGAETDQPLAQTLEQKGYTVHQLRLPVRVKTPDALWSAFFTCYNATPLAEDAGTIARMIRTLGQDGRDAVDVIGAGRIGLAVLFARALAGGKGKTVVDTGRFESASDEAYIEALYAPGLRRAGDVRTAVVLCASGPLCLFNTGDGFQTGAITGVYHALGVPLHEEKGSMSAEALVSWLAEK